MAATLPPPNYVLTDCALNCCQDNPCAPYPYSFPDTFTANFTFNYGNLIPNTANGPLYVPGTNAFFAGINPTYVPNPQYGIGCFNGLTINNFVLPPECYNEGSFTTENITFRKVPIPNEYLNSDIFSLSKPTALWVSTPTNYFGGTALSLPWATWDAFEYPSSVPVPVPSGPWFDRHGYFTIDNPHSGCIYPTVVGGGSITYFRCNTVPAVYDDPTNGTFGYLKYGNKLGLSVSIFSVPYIDNISHQSLGCQLFGFVYLLDLETLNVTRQLNYSYTSWSETINGESIAIAQTGQAYCLSDAGLSIYISGYASGKLVFFGNRSPSLLSGFAGSGNGQKIDADASFYPTTGQTPNYPECNCLKLNKQYTLTITGIGSYTLGWVGTNANTCVEFPDSLATSRITASETDYCTLNTGNLSDPSSFFSATLKLYPWVKQATIFPLVLDSIPIQSCNPLVITGTSLQGNQFTIS